MAEDPSAVSANVNDNQVAPAVEEIQVTPAVVHAVIDPKKKENFANIVCDCRLGIKCFRVTNTASKFAKKDAIKCIIAECERQIRPGMSLIYCNSNKANVIGRCFYRLCPRVGKHIKVK